MPIKKLSNLFLLLFFSSFLLPSLKAENSLDSERLKLELSMQERVEEALGRILPPGQFVVVIRIEPLSVTRTSKAAASEADNFFLPGVPTKSDFNESSQDLKNLISNLDPDKRVFQRFIKRIQATLVLDDTISEEKVQQVRVLTRQMIGLDPKRGDTLDIQRTAFQKQNIDTVVDSGMLRLQQSLRNYWLLIALSVAMIVIVVFFLFVFGPLRGFLNRFVQVLTMLKPIQPEPGAAMKGSQISSIESQILPGIMQAVGGLTQPAAMNGPGGNANFSGSLSVENPNKTSAPFSFIHEKHLSNLAVLMSREPPDKAAVVLGYLPSQWISRVLSKMEPAIQSEVTYHLSSTRQLLPEQVEDIEQDLKRRLDYLVGGTDQVIDVYEALEPEAQRKMLEGLKTSRPDVADEIRRRTMSFEDLESLENEALKSIFKEVELDTLVMSLKGVHESLREKILGQVSEGKAEIIREELELSDGRSGKGTLEAQRVISRIAKRLEAEGKINIPQVHESLPDTRYGASLKDSIKIPEGINLPDPPVPNFDSNPGAQPANIKDEIKSFMSRPTRTEKKEEK